jgi:hypothetical protein
MRLTGLAATLLIGLFASPTCADEVPKAFQGTWSSSKASCDEDMPNGIVVLEVTSDSLGFYEIGCALSGFKQASNAVSMEGSCSKGGMEKDEVGKMWLTRLGPDALSLAYAGYKFMANTDDTYYRCARQPAPPPGTEGTAPTTTMLHNGSVVSLKSQGNQRTITYLSPRPGMIAAGAKSGDVLFTGVVDGEVWRGKAAVFNQRCGRREFAVTGKQSASDGLVTLAGEAPHLSENCLVVKTVSEKLVFTRGNGAQKSN